MSEPARSQRTWHSWRMDELAAADTATDTAQAQAEEQARQRSQLETQREHALQEAREQGHREGLAAGHAEGYREGLAQALEEGRQQAAEARAQSAQAVSRLLENLDRALARVDVDITHTLTDVALAAARHLAHEALDAKPDRVCALIARLLHEEPFLGGQTCLWLHPDDALLLSDELGDELQLAGWRVRKDASLTRGGCRVSGPDGELDATREARWQALLDRHRPAARARPPAPVEAPDSA